MKIIIAGSRYVNDRHQVERAVMLWKELHAPKQITEIVSGGGRGVDQLGEAWAQAQGLSTTRFPAEWQRYGKSAGPIRNRAMADYADGLIALPAQGSRGTKHMIHAFLQQSGKRGGVLILPATPWHHTKQCAAGLKDAGYLLSLLLLLISLDTAFKVLLTCAP